MRTTQRQVKWGIFLVTCAALPCFFFLVFCSGVLPVVVMALVVVKVGASEAAPTMLWLAAIPALEVSGYAFLLYRLARMFARRIVPQETPEAPRLLWGVILAVLALAALPIYSFDCMDGHSFTRCSAYDMYLGLFDPARTCGDLPW